MKRVLAMIITTIMLLSLCACGSTEKVNADGEKILDGMDLKNSDLNVAINALIGSAGVSAVPMAARVSPVEGQKANPKNFLLMHAMGPNVAGVIGSAIAAGVLLALFG